MDTSPTDDATLRIRVFTRKSRMESLPQIRNAVVGAGGWVLQRRALSAYAIAVRLEIHQGGMMDLYSALIGAGVEMTRGAHLAMCEACMCALHLPERRRRIGTVDMDVTFVGEIDVQEILMGEAALA